ncbi:MAG: F0F1 ATP synthase subunit B, partial [Planctomycetes bacterium]|nr:F0F1 ATP synthase subunit B [Planctomycetota bacterium]
GVATAWWSGSACAAGSEQAHAAATDEGASHGEPSAPLDFKTDLALWSVVTFVVFIVVLKKFAWGPLIEGLDKREARVRSELEEAEAARVKAQQLLAEHEERLAKVHDEVREIVAEARRDAEQTKNEILSQAQKEAEETRRRAIADIERARDDALKELFHVLSGQVIRATEHVLGRALKDDDQERLVQEALAELTEKAGSG